MAKPTGPACECVLMALERQVTFWVAALAVFIAVLWLLSDVLLPFVAGMALAYLLDPIARRARTAGHRPGGFGARSW